MYYLVVVWLSVPVPLIGWKDPYPKWPIIMCQVGHWTLLSHCDSYVGAVYTMARYCAQQYIISVNQSINQL